MFQKEFAERLLSNKLNSINSLIKCFFDIRLEFHVSKNCFRPIPKIESTVLKFEKLKRSLINKNEIERFIKFKRYILKNHEVNDNTKLDLRVEKLKLIELVNIFRQIKF